MKISRSFVAFVFTAIFSGHAAIAQHVDLHVKLHALLGAPGDTNTIISLIKLGQLGELDDTAVTFIAYMAALKLSRTLGNDCYEIKSLNNLGNYHSNAGRYGLAKVFYNSSLSLASSQQLISLQAISLNNLGNMFNNTNQNDSAIAYYLQASTKFGLLKDTLHLGIVYGNLAMLFNKQHLYQNSIKYGEKGIQFALAAGDLTGVAQNSINLADSYGKGVRDKRKMLQALQQGLHYAKMSGSNTYLEISLIDLGDYYRDIGEYKRANAIVDSAILIARHLGTIYYLGQAIALQGAIALSVGDKTAANRHLQEAIPYLLQCGFWQPLRDAYNTLATLESEQKHWQKAFLWKNLYARYKDSSLNETITLGLQAAEAKYQDAAHNQEILLLKSQRELQVLESRKKTIAVYLLGASIIVLTGFIILFYVNLKRKKKMLQQDHLIQAQRIKELERVAQLTGMQALVKGQETERNRVAKDLHDGLGSMLSGIKLNLQSMKGNVVLTEEMAALFTRSLDQLDRSIAEMRHVAHNMMPEALVKLGLVAAIQDLCEGINESGAIQIQVQAFYMDHRFDGTAEIVIYRIVQELLNNILKHAHATTALVQLSNTANKLSITVEDNGIGFDTSDVAKGAGLKNIQSRVQFLGGTIDIESKPGKGVSIFIECTIDSTHE